MLNKIRNKWNSIPLTVKVSTSYTICSILQRCVSLITLPLFTRLLTTGEYGQSTIYNSWSGIIGIFLTLNLAYGSFSTAMSKFESERDKYISSIQGICLVLSIVFTIIYLPFAAVWNGLFELPTFLVIVMEFEILSNTAIQLWSGKKRFEFKYKSVIFVTILSTIVSPIISVILIMNTDEKGYARILGYSITTITIGGFFYIFNLIKGKKLFYKEFCSYAIKFNIPLLAYYLSQIVFNQSDRIMISHYCGVDKAAMYGVAYNFAVILTFVLNAINNSYVPWFYGKLKDGRQRDNKNVACYISIIMAVLLLGVIWFAPEIIIIMAGPKYKEAIGVIPPVAISLLLLFYAQLFINAEFYYEEKKSLVFASIGAAIINIVLNALLIPHFGFVVAGYTTLFSYIVFAISNYYALKKVSKQQGFDFDCYDIKKLIIIFILLVICSVIGNLLYRWFVSRLTITIIIGIAILFNIKKIKKIYLNSKK